MSVDNFIKEKVEVEDPDAEIVFSSSVPSEKTLSSDPERMILWIVGLRGVGKTTLGLALSEKLGRPFAEVDTAEDMDRVLVQRGIAAVAPDVVLDENCRKIMVESGRVFYLMGDALLVARRRTQSDMPGEKDIADVAVELRTVEPAMMQCMSSLLRAIDNVDELIESVNDALRVWERQGVL